MSVTHLLIHTVTVQRNTPVNQGAGRFLDEYADLHVGIPFRIAGNQSQERYTGDQQNTLVTHLGYGEPGLDIKRDDHITNVVRDDGSADPALYRVVGTVPPSKTHHTKVLLEQIARG